MRIALLVRRRSFRIVAVVCLVLSAIAGMMLTNTNELEELTKRFPYLHEKQPSRHTPVIVYSWSVIAGKRIAVKHRETQYRLSDTPSDLERHLINELVRRKCDVMHARVSGLSASSLVFVRFPTEDVKSFELRIGSAAPSGSTLLVREELKMNFFDHVRLWLRSDSTRVVRRL